MISTDSIFPLHAPNWDGSNNDADLKDYATPSTGSFLRKVLPPAIRDKVWISTVNRDPANLYKSQIHLINGHWMSIIDDCIYCSLGGNYSDEFPDIENETKYMIRQTPYSAVCGAYVVLFCIGEESGGDPMAYIEPITNPVMSFSKNYDYDLLRTGINQRIDNDRNVTYEFNKRIELYKVSFILY